VNGGQAALAAGISDRSLQATFDQAPVGIAHVGVEGAWLRVNARLCELLGYSAAELAELTVQELTHPDDLDGDLAQAALLADGEIDSYRLEKRYLRKDGSTLWAQLSGSAVRDENGRLMHFLAIVEDIGARKRAEADAEKARSTLEAVLDSAPLGIALLDMDLRYTRINERLAELNGLGVADHLGRTPMELLPQIPQESYLPHWQRVLDTGEPLLGVEFEAATPAAPGVLRSFREDWYPILVEESVVALAALVTETTDERRRAAERERLAAAELIAAERQQAAQVLAAVGDGIVAVDAGSQITYLNAAAMRILSTRAELAQGSPIARVVGGWTDVEDRIPIAATTESAPVATLPFELHGGRESWLSIGGVRYANGIVYAFRDQTGEHRLEQLRREFITTLSHELRTPLAAVYGGVHTLLRSDVDFDRDSRRPLLEMAVEQAERLRELADRVLVVEELDSDALALNEQPVDPNELVHRLVDAHRTRTQNGQVVEVEEATAPRIVADPHRLESVLAALLDNAIKFSPNGGRVAVAATASDRHVRFTVSDTGIGIAAGDQERIFEKFYRSDPEQTLGIGGAGLGLYIARTLAERMGGAISVDSQPGTGATFVVTLPRREAAAGHPPQHALR
jgi:PAS domain S-box-containing protein